MSRAAIDLAYEAAAQPAAYDGVRLHSKATAKRVQAGSAREWPVCSTFARK
jgi:hypothetical protein